MTTPTRQEIIDAHEALLELSGLAEELAVTEVETRQAWKYHAYILAALPPRPQPTMAEVEWDDDLHYLAEATHPGCGIVIMIFQSAKTRNILVIRQDGGEQRHAYCPPDTLTPTGKRYTLTEVQE